MQYKKVTFPRDGLPHDNVIEWWYFNGHLWDKKGNYYAFMDCLFKADAKKVNIPLLSKVPVKYVHFSHSLLTDEKDRRFYHDIIPVCIMSEDSFTKQLLFANYTIPSRKGYFNYEIEETRPFSFRIKSRFFELKLTSKKKPLLEGGRGFLNLNSKQTYYYSLTNLMAEGWLMVGGRRIKVKGKSWMDHQWADVAYSRDRWSWFSIQLDNDWEMVCFEYDDGKKKTYLASVLDRKGREHHTEEVMIRPAGKAWVSPKTGAKYPTEWMIEVPSLGVELSVRSIIKEQEMFFSMINYWEGPMDVSGTIKGKKVRGKGFMELASYPMNKSFMGMYRDELKRSVKMSINSQLAGAKKMMLNFDMLRQIGIMKR